MVENVSNKRINWIPHNDNQSFEFLNFLDEVEIRTALSVKNVKQSNSEITSRILNHWEKIGLIDNDRPEGKGWRKFSKLDIVWMELIKELRNFGYSNDKILAVKKDLLSKSEDSSISESTTLQYYVAVAICFQRPVFAMVFSNGEIEFASLQEAASSYSLKTAGNHIRIELNGLIQRIYKKDISPKNRSLFQLSEKEFKVLEEIRTRGYKNINIKLSDEEIDSIEVEQSFNGKVNVSELLNDSDNQDIVLKKRKGKVVFATKTVKYSG